VHALTARATTGPDWPLCRPLRTCTVVIKTTLTGSNLHTACQKQIVFSADRSRLTVANVDPKDMVVTAYITALGLPHVCQTHGTHGLQHPDGERKQRHQHRRRLKSKNKLCNTKGCRSSTAHGEIHI
jgi:hypothetical protein